MVVNFVVVVVSSGFWPQSRTTFGWGPNAAEYSQPSHVLRPHGQVKVQISYPRSFLVSGPLIRLSHASDLNLMLSYLIPLHPLYGGIRVGGGIVCGDCGFVSSGFDLNPKLRARQKCWLYLVKTSIRPGNLIVYQYNFWTSAAQTANWKQFIMVLPVLQLMCYTGLGRSKLQWISK